MCRCGLHVLPVSLVVITLVTFCTTYIIAVYRGDVPAFLPYISDTGTTAPESCIFGFFLNVSAALGACTMFVRYKILRSLPAEYERDSRCLNLSSLVVGSLSILGLCLVANFQEHAVGTVHIIGALLTFVCGTIYTLLQARISYNVYPQYCDLTTCRIRLGLGVVCLGCGVCLILGKIVSSAQFPHHDVIHWSRDDNGYTAHVVGVVSEWLTTIAFVLFFATYVQEFKASSVNVAAHLSPTYEGLGLRV